MSIEEIQYQCLKRNIPFYCYRLPDTKGVVMGVQKTPVVSSFDGFAEKNEKKGFLIAPFVLSEEKPPLFIKEDFCVTEGTSNEALETWIRSVHFEAENSETFECIQTQEEYLKEVSDLIRLLKESKLSKIVYSRVITLENRLKGCISNYHFGDSSFHCVPLPMERFTGDSSLRYVTNDEVICRRFLIPLRSIRNDRHFRLMWR